MNFIFEWQNQYFTNERKGEDKIKRENKTFVFKRKCNFLLIIWTRVFL